MILIITRLRPDALHTAHSSWTAGDSRLFIFTVEGLTSKPPFSLYLTPLEGDFTDTVNV